MNFNVQAMHIFLLPFLIKMLSFSYRQNYVEVLLSIITIILVRILYISIILISIISIIYSCIFSFDFFCYKQRYTTCNKYRFLKSYCLHVILSSTLYSFYRRLYYMSYDHFFMKMIRIFINKSKLHM